MIIGREKEREILIDVMKSNESSFIAIYGRRRIGKTFLVRETYNNNFTFYHTGIFNKDKKTQLKSFCNSLKEYGLENFKNPVDWIDAFELLKNCIKLSNEDKKVIFLDELSWLDTKKSGFISALEAFWNGWASARRDIVLIVSSSSSTWMINKVIHNKGGLYNRLNWKICLNPFSLRECKDLLESKEIHLNENQILKLYMAFGGVPFYWNFIEKGKSADQNINSLFFSYNAPLKEEFQHLYSALFLNYKDYINIVEVLCSKKSGMTRSEICKELKMASSGSLTECLTNLEASGFIRLYNNFNHKNEKIYQIIDEFTLFYYSFVKDNGKIYNYWIDNIGSIEQKVWAVLSFELTCLKHIEKIKTSLGIQGISTQEFLYRCKQNNEKKVSGCQIDLLINRKDNVINLCEIKYCSDGLYAIDKDEYEKILRRKSAFINNENVKKQVWITLITTFGLEENSYHNVAENIVTLKDLFL